MSRKLVLASGSGARRALLDRLRLPYTVDSPDIDESALPDEAPRALAERLAREKALAVQPRHGADSIIIGSDQVASAPHGVLGKPGTQAKAVEQLGQCSGQTVHFFTAWCVAAQTGLFTGVDETRVVFRELSEAEIHRYVEIDQPLECAGSFKAESLGVSLFEEIVSVDPTGLIGLPLIGVSGALRQLGLPV